MEQPIHPRRILADAIAEVIRQAVPAGVTVCSTDDWDAITRPVVLVQITGCTCPHPRADAYTWVVTILAQADDQQATAAARARHDALESAVEEAVRYPAALRSLLWDAGLSCGAWALENRAWTQAPDGARAMEASGVARIIRAHPDATF